ncbi:hypothetical protein HMPREF2898_01200 [Atopobium sp. HMSC064B08]|nr:hypothetical protein HMPREF2898_01200 [Atopobium sp. HMSC064B08]
MKRKGAISRIILVALVAFSMSMPTPALAEMSTEFGSTLAQGPAEAVGTTAPAQAEKNNGLSTESSAEPNEPKDDNVKHEETRTEANSTSEAPASDSSESSTNSQTEPEKTQAQTQAKEDSQKSLTQETWTTTASDGTQITVSGKLPSGGSVLAVPKNISIKGQTTLLAFDITIRDAHGTKWEPAGSPIAVNISSSRISGNSVSVWHISDSSSVEQVSSPTSAAGSVSFTAKGFSVYAVTTPDTHFTKTYRFHVIDASGTDSIVSTQKLSDDERLIEPATPSGNGTFSGWKTSSGSTFTDFGKTAAELNGAALDATAEASPVDLYASFTASNRPEYVDTDDVTVAPSNPTRTGYTFAGWKTSNGTTFTFGSKLTQSIHLTASWTPNANTVYHVNYWIQKSTDPYNAAAADKTYTLYTVQGYTAATDATVSPATTDVASKIAAINGQYYGHLFLDTERSDGSATVAADGSTTLNVYLDRSLVRVNFYNSKADYTNDVDKTGVENYSGNAVHTFLGLYGATFTPIEPEAGYRWFDGNLWYAQSPSSFKSPGSRNRTASRFDFYPYKVNLTKNFAIYTDKADGNGYSANNASWIPADGTFSFSTNQAMYSYVKYGYYTPTGTPKDPKDLNLDTDITQWFDISKGEGPAIYDAASGDVAFKPLPTKYLVMVRKRIIYNLTLKNAATSVTSETTISTEQRKYGASLADISNSTPSRPAGLPQYYRFAGWYRDAQLTMPLTSDNSMPSSDTSLYAKWEPVPVNVTYVYNNGTPNKTVSVPAQTTLDEPTGITRDGYVLVAWLRNDGKPYRFGSPVTEDITLTAKWVPINQTHTITYDLAGGTGSVSDPMHYAEGSDIRVLDASGVTPPAGSRGFICWVASDGTRYYPGDLIPMGTSDISLRAVWANSNVVRLAYDLNYEGAPGRTYSDFVESNDTLIIDAADPVRAGYRFLGWSISKEGGALLHRGDKVEVDTINAEGNVLYAQWERIDESTPAENKTASTKAPGALPDTGDNSLAMIFSLATTGLFVLVASTLHRRRTEPQA